MVNVVLKIWHIGTKMAESKDRPPTELVLNLCGVLCADYSTKYRY
jgi:hypothetical protein